MLVQVYGRELVSRKCVYEWFKRFREGKETTQCEPRSGRPSTSRTPEMMGKVRQTLAQDRRLTLRLIAEELGISRNTAHTNDHDDLGKRKVFSRFVQHKFTAKQKEERMDTSGDFSFLEIIVTGDETWCYQFGPESKPRSMTRCSPNYPPQEKSSARIQGQNTVDHLLRQQRHRP